MLPPPSANPSGRLPVTFYSSIDQVPAFDDYWSEHNIAVRKDGEEMHLEPRPVVKAAELAPLVEERKQTERDASKGPIMDHVA